ncbi:D-alanyl-D-alanine carboxypeptidase/D-alanyl-D-alanine-endopeptidase [Lentiprolixibacter aurantiacus]|uniref:D-alanyl-D-alanine carboxypeptidase n=1 Tax=Lentiprolixibacter aurantiacus TaxID=2993939 RepID=A0AAE3MMT0_9FLAO|nr:D-alanyl-D-alanine carboxypeptidase [Lentiprolixibacter aurantiacus]MCX2720298.1 D-alanyl-D-alanine carboxypeptidase [Lentiprolixibacter aurantiacus]
MDNKVLNSMKYRISLTLKTIRAATKPIVYILIISALYSCASTGKSAIRKVSRKTLTKSFYQNQFTGIMILDPENQDTLLSRNSDKYFTPASNTKIFTFYTALQFLPEKIPVINYTYLGDTLVISGTGDPTQFHPYFQDSTLYHFLKKHDGPIAIHHPYFADDPLGPGWAWDDYDQYYSAERSSLPLYGNVLTIIKDDSLRTYPSLFREQLLPAAVSKKRSQEANVFFYDPDRTDTLEIPFKTDSMQIKLLLEKAIGRRLLQPPGKNTPMDRTLSGILTDSVLKRMMHESDNFLAEQLLLMVSNELSDSLSTDLARKYILSMSLSDLPQMPRWVDGSGLSRYNLFTPESMVHVLTKLYRQIPRQRLFDLFPAGGESSTLKDWFPGDSKPYIFAKSGTLGNNYNLSGYLITKKGKVLIFSFMNNHFRKPSAEIKTHMQEFLEGVRDHY